MCTSDYVTSSKTLYCLHCYQARFQSSHLTPVTSVGSVLSSLMVPVYSCNTKLHLLLFLETLGWCYHNFPTFCISFISPNWTSPPKNVFSELSYLIELGPPTENSLSFLSLISCIVNNLLNSQLWLEFSLDKELLQYVTVKQMIFVFFKMWYSRTKVISI
jgi:hypothetical protein